MHALRTLLFLDKGTLVGLRMFFEDVVVLLLFKDFIFLAMEIFLIVLILVSVVKPHAVQSICV